MYGSLLDQVLASLPALERGFADDSTGREAAIGQLDELLDDLQREANAGAVEQRLLELLLDWPHTRRPFMPFVPAGVRSRGDNTPRPPLPSLQELFEVISAVKNALVRARPVSLDEQVVAYLEQQPQPAASQQEPRQS